MMMMMTIGVQSSSMRVELCAVYYFRKLHVHMMAAEDYYLKVYAQLRSHDNYNELFPAMVSKLSNLGLLNLSSVKSCLTIGPGDGERELQLIKQCMPYISQLIAVEPDHESAERLRTRLTKNLSGVESQVFETNIQSWQGLDIPVDLVMMMLCLYYVSPSERKELFKKTHEQWLASGGRVIVVSSSRTRCPGNANEIYERLGTPMTAWEDIEADLLDVGFIKQYAHEVQCTRDFSNLDESYLRFFQYHIDQPVTLDDVRNVIQEMFPDGKSNQLFYMLAVFQKP